MNWTLTINHENIKYRDVSLSILIRQILQKTTAFLDLSFGGHVIFNVVTATTMKKINLLHYPFVKVSNILAFPLNDNWKSSNVKDPLGEIYFCWPVIVQESKQNKITFLRYSCQLLIHSVLHLLNFDHQNNSQAELMKQISQQIFHTVDFNNLR